MDERPKYKMRFVGYDANGELKPTAPAYKKHEVRELPLEYAQDFWWELVDAVPDLVIPEPRYEDSVFIEEVFVPHDDEAPTPPPEDKPLSLKEFAPAVKNGYFGEKWEESVETYGRDVDEGESPIDAEDEAAMTDLDATEEHPSLNEHYEDEPIHITSPQDDVDAEEPVYESHGEYHEPYGSSFIEGEPGEVTVSHSGELGETPTVTLEGAPYEKMTVKELKALIEQRGVKGDSQWRKADLIREARKLEESSSLT